MPDLFSLGSGCECEVCQPDRPGKTHTGAWRHETEVREVAKMKSNEDRARYLQKVEKARGIGAARRLRADVWKMMKGEE